LPLKDIFAAIWAVPETLWLLDWTKTGLEVHLDCWGTAEEKERLWAEVEEDSEEA
jgi:hypothetical protein